MAQTSQCHDITAYPEIGLAAGACQGDGLLLDISDPVNPKRIDNVTDNNFAYWHSASFNNDGTKVVFTDEWGGGAGANCQPGQPENWGANAIFDIVTAADGTKQMEFASYYSIPNVQSSRENCVAHNGNLVPVPGRDVMVQAWYQGGLSVFDFTDSSAPKEIAYFDRGPITSATTGPITLGGFWSTYWNNGEVVGSEIRLGTETFGLKTSPFLTEDELAAAREYRSEQTNVQSQERIVWEPSFSVVGARFDQAVRDGSLDKSEARQAQRQIDRAEAQAARGDMAAAAFTLESQARNTRGAGEEALKAELERLADAL